MSNYRTPLQIHLSWHWVTDVLPSRLPQLFVEIVGCIVGGQDGDVNCLHDIFLLQNLDSHSRACIQIPNRKGSIQNPAGTQIRTTRHWAYNSGSKFSRLCGRVCLLNGRGLLLLRRHCVDGMTHLLVKYVLFRDDHF